MNTLRRSRWLVLTLVVALVAAMLPATLAHAQGGGNISYGSTVSGQLSNASYFDVWQFQGSKGDRIRIVMNGDATLDPYLGLLDANTEQVVAEDDDSAGNSDALLELTLPANSSYLIVATRYDFDAGSSQGSYTLTLTAANVPTDGPGTDDPIVEEDVEVAPGVYYKGDVPVGEPVSGSISADAWAHGYSLELQAGQQVLIGMFADGSTVDAYLIFSIDGGDVLAEDDDSGAQFDFAVKTDAFLNLTVQEDGVYYIIATRAGLDAGKTTGAYALLVEFPEGASNQPETPDEGAPDGVQYQGDIASGDTVSGSISAGTFVYLYTYNGQAGETITITMNGTGGLDAYLGLLDPADNVIAEDDDSAGGMNAQITVTLPESGVYVIVATRNGLDEGKTTGDFELIISGEAETDLGGFGGLPGRAFDTPEGTFYLPGFGASDDPAKNTPIEDFLGGGSDDLPGRAFEVETFPFRLTGFGATNDPAKFSDLQSFLDSFRE